MKRSVCNRALLRCRVNLLWQDKAVIPPTPPVLSLSLAASLPSQPVASVTFTSPYHFTTIALKETPPPHSHQSPRLVVNLRLHIALFIHSSLTVSCKGMGDLKTLHTSYNMTSRQSDKLPSHPPGFLLINPHQLLCQPPPDTRTQTTTHTQTHTHQQCLCSVVT